jgi:hypothetical protein
MRLWFAKYLVQSVPEVAKLRDCLLARRDLPFERLLQVDEQLAYTAWILDKDYSISLWLITSGRRNNTPPQDAAVRVEVAADH